MSKKYQLTATPRTLVGRKVKQLRAAGQLPANIFGKGVESMSIAVATDAFEKVYDQAGETGLIELTVDSAVHPVLVHTVQVHPVTSEILHIEFFQVNLKEKVHANVPLETVGESLAVKDSIGALLTPVSEVEVEALPAEIPESIEVDISTLAALDDEIKVKELKVPAGVTVLTDPEMTVAKIAALVQEEEPEPAPAVEGEAAEGETPAEGAEGAEAPADAEGKEAAEEKKDAE